jgi:hypothetical protein
MSKSNCRYCHGIVVCELQGRVRQPRVHDVAFAFQRLLCHFVTCMLVCANGCDTTAHALESQIAAQSNMVGHGLDPHGVLRFSRTAFELAALLV